MAGYAATFNYPYNALTTTSIRVGFTALAAAFVSCGLVKTADTGQTAPSTITNTIGDNTFYNFGYEVYSFNDALQPTLAVFFRIEYCMAGQRHLFNLTVGTSTDGAGNITGQKTPLMQFQPATAGPTGYDNSTNQVCYISGNTNRLCFAFCTGPTRYPGYFINIERSQTLAGADNADGIIVHAQLSTNSNSLSGSGQTRGDPFSTVSMFVPATGAIAAYQTSWVGAYNYNDISMVLGANIGSVLPIPFCYIPYNPGKGCLIYYSSDYAAYGSYVIPVYGTNYTYLALDQVPETSPVWLAYFSQHGGGNARQVSAGHILMRYDTLA